MGEGALDLKGCRFILLIFSDVFEGYEKQHLSR